MADLLVVIPTYNEAESVEAIITRTRSAIPEADILIVDDNSPDGTGSLADAIAATDASVRVLHRSQKDGLGRAYLAGFEVGFADGYAYVSEMDADGSHDPAALPAMLALARSGADLVIGSRWVPGGSVHNWPWLRKAISRGGNWYSRVVLGSRIRDITAGFRVYRASELSRIVHADISSQGYCFQVELAWQFERAGLKVVEHPISFVERESGESKMHAGIVTEALVRVTGWGLTRGLRRRTSQV